MNVKADTKARPYRMKRRAAAAAETRQQIVSAAIELSLEHWYDEITLRQIAARAGVALQAVVNHFGTKEGIVTAALEQPIPAEMMTRTAAEPGDIKAAVRLLVSDYEWGGDAIFRSLALEERIASLRPWIEMGRREHRRWVERV